MTWPMKRLRYLATFNPPVPSSVRTDAEGDYPLLPMDSINEFTETGAPEVRPVGDLLNGYSYLEPTDVAYAKVTPCFENGKGLIGSVLDGPTFATTEITVLRPHNSVNQRFLGYLLQSSTFRHAAIASMAGAGGLKRVSETAMRDLRVPAPPLEEQRLIADYLDRETAEIDAFIADLRLLEEITHERYERAWSEAFASASLFEARRVKFVVNSLVDGPFGSALTSSHYADEGSPVVRLGNIGRNEFVLEPRVYVPNDYARQLASHAVEPGDVVIAGLGDLNHPLGRAAVVPSEFGVGIVKADCYRARPNHHVTSEYLAWALSSPLMNDYFREIGRGSTRVRLNLGIVGNASIPVPPVAEQRKIIESAHLRSGERDSAIELIESAISLAQERRSALISAAVTGQIDVAARGVSVAERLRDELGVHV